jgi:hypothetical protein
VIVMPSISSLVQRLSKQDPAARRQRDEWLDDVTRLLGRIRTWVKKEEARGRVKVTETTVDITEADLGEYRAPGLELRLPGGHLVRVEPRGARIVSVVRSGARVVGLKGRVDMSAGSKRALLLRTGRDTWRILSSGAAAETPALLTAKTFGNALSALFQ